MSYQSSYRRSQPRDGHIRALTSCFGSFNTYVLRRNQANGIKWHPSGNASRIFSSTWSIQRHYHFKQALAHIPMCNIHHAAKQNSSPLTLLCTTNGPTSKENYNYITMKSFFSILQKHFIQRSRTHLVWCETSQWNDDAPVQLSKGARTNPKGPLQRPIHSSLKPRTPRKRPMGRSQAATSLLQHELVWNLLVPPIRTFRFCKLLQTTILRLLRVLYNNNKHSYFVMF